MKYRVDANVPSDATKPIPNVRVVDWLRHRERDLRACFIISGEREFGIRMGGHELKR